MKKTLGFYITLIAALLGVVSIIMYGSSLNTSKNAYGFMIAAAVIAILVALGAAKFPGLCNWGAVVAAALAATGIAYSITVMSDAIGYVISGLYSADTLSSWIRFIVVACISWLFYVIAAFTGAAKEEA